MADLDVPVLIVGGGGCGLSASIFLSNLGVEHLLVERHETTSHLPKAHYINQRTMEVFRQHGVADAIYEVGAPIEKFGKVRWRTSLGGDGELDQRSIHEMDAFGGGSLRPTYEADSPCLASNYPQLRLEPLLRRQAEARAPESIRYHHDVIDWEQTDTGVVATVHDRTADTRYTVAARYVIAADGGRSFGPALGVEMTGPTGMVDMVSTHFSADLSPYWDDESLITWFLNPEGENSWGAGAMVQMGPTWGRKSEEWVVHFAFRPDDPERFNEEAIVPRLRELLRLPDVDMTVHKVSHWILDRIVAQQWRFGDIFLAGDAAHRQPPTTGLGLNTGIQDVHNLAWKLAAVLSGKADDRLLDTYEAERKAVSTHGADWALLAFMNHTVIDAGIGLTPGAPVEMNTAAFHALFSEGLMGEALRARAAVCIGTQAWEFQAHDVEIGFNYPEGALVPDGSEPAPRDPSGRVYTPTTRPGHRLPHAWLARGADRLSTHDLLDASGGFVLLTGTDASGWKAAAAAASEKFGVTVTPVAVGADGDCTDPEDTWNRLRQVGADGAILVRPDHHVAYRAEHAPVDPTDALNQALASVLAR
ncbi:FAD-dependent monooxygenase [Actinomycetospora sp. CA-101289]|uniref:FAD-dependent monooxygenase n=1 Tax=Actinomycetospora sp. CA-101289 TaxID=3239893 RepID=UPI003D992DE5